MALTGAALSPVIAYLACAHALHASSVSIPGAHAAWDEIENLTSFKLTINTFLRSLMFACRNPQSYGSGTDYDKVRFHGALDF